MSDSIPPAISRLVNLIDRLRPNDVDDAELAERNVRAEAARLRLHPDEAVVLRETLCERLTQTKQTAFYSETGVASALGFWLELRQRFSYKLLPPAVADEKLSQFLARVFHAKQDHLWVAGVSDEAWMDLADAMGLGGDLSHLRGQGIRSVLDAVRVLSYRLAGVALDRELLNAEPSLEAYESPFLAQNAALVVVLERVRAGGARLDAAEVRDVDVLLDQCVKTIERVRRRAGEHGISIRLTYQISRISQLIVRLRRLLDLLAAEACLPYAIALFKTLLEAEKTHRKVLPFIGENIALLARNVTDCASRHGEHYIADNRADWWAMARGAAGGGIVIAFMAMIKIRLSLLHLPPLTEAIAFSLNYGVGFVLIHLLGFSVATKQPAMTAASIAATVEESNPRDLVKFRELVQNVTRTQFIAVLGNVGLALPIACLIATVWPLLFGELIAPVGKITSLLHDIDPVHSGALIFAAVAGVGLFLSGLVSGVFDNDARYYRLAQRIAHAPLFQTCGKARAARFGHYLDTHFGAIVGNIFFGFYLGMAGAVSTLTGLPIDIRHVAFSSANLGTAVTSLGVDATRDMLGLAIAGVLLIALVNLIVSFALALYVAMKSRRLGARHILWLARGVAQHFVRHPFSYLAPPPASDRKKIHVG